MDDWNLDERHVVSDSNCNIVTLECPNLLTLFSVGDTTWAVYN